MSEINSLDNRESVLNMDREELVHLAAVDEEMFCKGFFPQTFRDPMPGFAGDLWFHNRDPRKRLLNYLLFRGSSKTTNLRALAAYRIAYGISRTILFISKSEGHVKNNVGWIKRNIERNSFFTATYGLEAAESPWTETYLLIHHRALEHPIHLIGMGITGSVRGLNIEDYRPDLIIVDDVIDEENSATPEQRDKIENLILGALVNSLAPKTENPDSKLVMLQTPFDFEDASMKAFDDPMWHSYRQGCWTKETENLPIDQQVSVWPERFPSEDLRKDKRGHLARNKASLFAREQECKLTSPETADFRPEWLRYYNLEDIPWQFMPKVLAIDPVPPPSEIQVAKDLHGKDYEALAVVGYYNGGYYVLEYVQNRGHDPNWTVAKFFEFWFKWRVRAGIIETIAYQRTLKFLIESEMKKRGRYLILLERENQNRAKRDKVVQALNGPASQGMFFVQKEHSELISQFCSFPKVQHDDVIEAVSMGIEGLMWAELEDMYDDDVLDMEDSGGTFKVARGAP